MGLLKRSGAGANSGGKALLNPQTKTGQLGPLRFATLATPTVTQDLIADQDNHGW